MTAQHGQQAQTQPICSYFNDAISYGFGGDKT